MNASLTAVRAIGVAFANRMLRPLILAGSIASVLVVCLGVWLVSLSAWWLLLAVPAFLGVIMFGVLVIIVWLVLRPIAPAQTAEQKRAVADFVDKLARVSGNIKTPPFIILFRVVRDTLWPRQSNFITTLSHDSTTLHKDFIALQKHFSST